MDPVSRILASRERSSPRMAPWAIIAFVLHASVVGVIFIMARAAPARPVQMPAVSVKIIRPPARKPKTAPDPGPIREQSTAPQPTKVAPRATAKPQPSRPPATKAAPVASKKPAQAASDSAMEAINAAKTPAPTQPPPPAAASSGGGGSQPSGLSIGGGDSSQVAGVPSDFQFTYYINRMLALIESRWYKPPVAPETAAQVGFRITKNGQIQAVQLEKSSGVPTFDRAVLRALYAANPLPPLPPAYLKPSLTIHLTFSE